jgi:fructose-specific phosphotransferase system component IIB
MVLLACVYRTKLYCGSVKQLSNFSIADRQSVIVAVTYQINSAIFYSGILSLFVSFNTKIKEKSTIINYT